MPITFDQVYWYTNTCPLRRVVLPVVKEDADCRQVRKMVHDLVLGIMAGRIGVPLCMQTFANRTRKRRITIGFQDTHSTTINLINSAFWCADIWRSSKGIREDDFIHPRRKEFLGPNNMDAHVDLVRFKRTGEELSYLNLTWLRYTTELPDAKERSIMMQYTNYHARAYHLTTNTKPTQLDVFYPLLNYVDSFIYNPECGYEVIAELINRGAYYGTPSSLCNECTKCAITLPK